MKDISVMKDTGQCKTHGTASDRGDGGDVEMLTTHREKYPYYLKLILKTVSIYASLFYVRFSLIAHLSLEDLLRTRYNTVRYGIQPKDYWYHVLQCDG